MSDFDMDVRTKIPAEMFKKLHAIALANHTTVGALVAELVRRQFRTRVPRPGLTPEREAKLRELYELRYSDASIAARMGVSESAVCRYRRDLGLPAWHSMPSRRRPSEQEAS